MNPRVATVLSAREWEPGLVAWSRETAGLRIVLRAYRPEEIDQRIGDLDVVVAGAEVAWVTPARIAAWRRSGLIVVGVHPVGDTPAAEALAIGGAHEIVADDLPPEALAQVVRFAAPVARSGEPETIGELVAVVGCRGAPGTTEVALAVAWERARHTEVALVDLDLDAPALAVRLGLPPRPDLVDAADAARAEGTLPDGVVHRVGALAVIVGSHRPGETPLRPALVDDAVAAALGRFELVVCDLGAADGDETVLKRADRAILVVDATAIGIVRAARLVDAWAGPPPDLVLNRVAHARADAVAAAKRWLGLDPAAVVPDRPTVRAAASAARPPDRRFRRALTGVAR